MRQRTYIWMIIVLLTSLSAVIIFTSRWSTTGKDFASLLPSDAKNVDRIALIHETDTLRFIKENEEWKYGDEVLQREAVNNLIYASEDLSLQSIRPFAEIASLDYVLEIIFRDGKRESAHFIFMRSGSAYYIYEPGSSVVFAVELAGAGSIPLEKFFSNDLNHYREHLLISLYPSEISSLEVHPIKGSPFRLTQDDDGNISVFRMDDSDITDQINERRIRMLLSYFTNIRYDGIAEGDQLTDRSDPDAIIRLEDRDGDIYRLAVYQWIKPGSQGPDIFEALANFNDGADMLQVNYFYLDLVIRGLETYLR